MKSQSSQTIITLLVLVIVVSGCASLSNKPPSTQSPTQPLPSDTVSPLPTTQLPPPPTATQAYTPTATQPRATPTAAPPPHCQPLPQVASDIMPKDVVLNMVECLNAGDVQGALSYFVEDALIYKIGMPPTGFEFSRGMDALSQTWIGYIADNLLWGITINSVQNSPDGSSIYTISQIWLDVTRQLEIAPYEFFDNFRVENGKIISYVSTMTQESLSRLRPVETEIMPFPEPTPDTSLEIPGSVVSFFTTDDTCTYNGPKVWKSGMITINWEVQGQGSTKKALAILSLEEGKDFVDLMAATSGSEPPYWSSLVFNEELAPGESKTFSLIVGQKPLYVICWGPLFGIQPIGSLGPYEVRP